MAQEQSFYNEILWAFDHPESSPILRNLSQAIQFMMLLLYQQDKERIAQISFICKYHAYLSNKKEFGSIKTFGDGTLNDGMLPRHYI